MTSVERNALRLTIAGIATLCEIIERDERGDLVAQMATSMRLELEESMRALKAEGNPGSSRGDVL